MHQSMKKTGDDKESRIINRPINDDVVTLKQHQIQLNSEIMKLKAEVKLLTEINTRVNRELTDCQRKLGITPGDRDMLKGEPADEIIRLPAQLHEFDFLLPLLTAYDDKIEKLDTMLEKTKEEILEMDKKSEKVVQDNIYLRIQLEKKCQQLLDFFRLGNADDGLGNMYSKLEKEELTERMKILSEENGILMNNIKDLSLKLHQATKNVDDKNDEISGLLTRFSEVSKRNKELEFDLEDVRKAKEVLETKWKNSNEEISRLEIEKEEFLSKINKIENENKISKSQIQSQKKSYLELEEKKHLEIELLTKEIDSIKLKERDLGNRIIYMERDLDASKEECRRIKKELENTKNDLDQTMKLMENFETKVQFLQKKEENMQNIVKQSKEKVEDALVQRDRALLKEENYQKNN